MLWREAMQESQQFRCPFEKKGREEGAILEVALGGEKEERLAAIVGAFIAFHATPTKMGISFKMPKGAFKDCISTKMLREAIVPYQAELIAGELEYRLNPFLSHQWKGRTQEEVLKFATLLPVQFAASVGLMDALRFGGVPQPKGLTELATWFEVMLGETMKTSLHTPQLKMFAEDDAGEKHTVLTISPSSVVVHAERRHLNDPASNKNCFGVVKGPFYPKAFGRYSEDVEIVVSREADFGALSSETRRMIRHRSNEVLQAHGVHIPDLDETKQETGVWVPEYSS